MNDQRKDLFSPCTGCEERREACHGKCVKYSEWKKLMEKKRAFEREKREQGTVWDPQMPKRHWR